MAEARNDNNRANIPQALSSDCFQKWNGGRWEKVNLRTTSPPEPEPSHEEDVMNNNGLTMRVMEIVGLPELNRPSFYSGLVEEVQEIVNLPSDTASTLCSIVSWVLGKKEAVTTVCRSEVTTLPDKEPNLLEGSTRSTESILTGPESRIQTPFQLSLTDITKVKEYDEDNVCIRLPSLVAIKPSDCLLNGQLTRVYSCQLLQDQQTNNEDDPNEKEALDRKVTFAASESERRDRDAHVFQHPHHRAEMVEETEERDFNHNVIRPLQEEKRSSENRTEQIVDSPQNTPPFASGPAPPPPSSQSDLEVIRSVKEEAEATSTAPTPSHIVISTPPPSPTQVGTPENAAKTPGQAQLELQENLKKLEEIVKKLYKALNKDGPGPLRIVANFVPKKDGKMSVNIKSNTEVERASSPLTEEMAPASYKIQNPVQTPPSTSPKDTETESGCAGGTESDFAPVSVKVVSAVKSKSQDTKFPQHDRNPAPQRKLVGNKQQPLKSTGVKLCREKPLQSVLPSPTGLHKRSSFLGRMAVTGQAPVANRETAASGSRTRLDANNTFDINNNNSKPPQRPILKQTLMNRTRAGSLTRNSSLLTPAMVHSSDFPNGASEPEDFQGRSSSTTNTPYETIMPPKYSESSQSLQGGSKRLTCSPIVPRRPLIKSRRSRSKSPNKTPTSKPLSHIPQPIPMMEGWGHPSHISSRLPGNVHVVKSCGAHKKAKVPAFHPRQRNLCFEQGDYVESDPSTTSFVSTSETLGSEETTATDTDPVENSRNFDFNYCQRPAARAPRSIPDQFSNSKSASSPVGVRQPARGPRSIPDQFSNSKSASSPVGVRQHPRAPRSIPDQFSNSKSASSPVGVRQPAPRTRTPTPSGISKDKQKFRATVYIPTGASNQRRINSYRELFEKQQNLLMDLTSRTTAGIQRKDFAHPGRNGRSP